MMKKQNNKEFINTSETFKQGLGGGILGAFVGAPGLGMALGMVHANKDKLKSFGDQKNCVTCGLKNCKCKKSAITNPEKFL